MNILVIDCAVTRLSIAVKTDDKFISHTYDIGMRQSEILVPVIDELLGKAGITSKELNYSALTIGPGSFTGLRLGISALKAIELAYNIPVYGISSLAAYSYSFENFCLPVLAGIDANKDKFYARITDGTNIILEDGDYEVSEISAEVSSFEKIIVCGPNAEKLALSLKDAGCKTELIVQKANALTTEALIKITEEMIEKGEKPLQDYDGPVYLRASEAELALNKKSE